MQVAAFPDLRMKVEDAFASGNKAVARVRFTGTHRGELMGIPATGKSVDVPVIDIMAFNDAGLVSEHWGVFDAMALMQQLGVIEGPPAG
jgi:predicted ester cyclase